jgi:phosphoglycerate dehydrogenase-like enzyme
MSRPKIYIHAIGPWAERYLDEKNLRLLDDFADVINDGPLTATPDDLADRLRDVNGILSLNGVGAPDITPEIIADCPDLKVAAISHWFHGLHDTAVSAWKEAGLTVIDSSDGNNFAVAQWSLGAILTGMFRFNELDRAMRSGVEWPDHELTTEFLDGQRVGIVGLGRIGSLMAGLLSPFNAELVGYDAYVNAEQAAEMGVRWMDLDELMATSDIITFHLPVTDDTARMITRKHIESIPDGVLVVNSARTAILDHDAFMEGLIAGRFRAVVDVFEPEPPPLDDPIRSLPNVVMTPHIAGSSILMCRVSGRTAINALRSFFAS